MTTTTRTILVLGVLALVGCGDEGTAAFSPDAGDGTGGAAGMAGAAGAAGGQAGASAVGTGGTPAAGGAIGNTFTRADHDMCLAWPVCPSDVVAPISGGVTVLVRSATCKTAFDGRPMACGGCYRKTQALACDPFVGRCVAPGVEPLGAPKGTLCADSLSAPNIRDLNGWILCTGFAQVDNQTNTSELVCED